MKAPIKRMKKDEIIWLAEHYCKHGMPYLEHYNCFLAEKPKDSPFTEKVGVFDIETTGFQADYDFMLSYAIMDLDTKEVIANIIKPEEIKSLKFDKRLVTDLVKDLQKFDRIIVYNGADYRFDIPFARTRALRWGLDFPLYKDIYVNDVYLMVKAKLKMSRKRLANVCDLLEIPAKEHPGKPNIWMKAGVGDKKSLDYILVHNIEDVVSLRELYLKLRDFSSNGKRSI